VFRPEVVSAHSALVFPNKLPCLLRALCKRQAVTRNKMEDPTPAPPNQTLATIVDKRRGERGKKKRGGRRKD